MVSEAISKIINISVPRIILLLLIAFISTYSYTQQSSIKFQYTPVKKAQISGPHSLVLPTNFEYLNIFKKDQRFAPDEPSSFSSIEYFFAPENITENLKYKWSLGLFRNHINGGIILDENYVHFGRGNSNFGVVSTLDLSCTMSNSFNIATFYQIGIGPLVTQLKNDELTISPAEWKINGLGFVSNLGLEIRSPMFLNRIKFHVGSLINFTFVKLRSIETVDNQNNNDKYSDLRFMTINKVPALNIGIYYFLHTKKDK